MITKTDLIAGFRRLGVAPGMGLMVHSSLSRFGQVEGGADAVIDALMELVTPQGTLLFPSFNHNQIYDQGGIFDLAVTRCTNGIIPDTFWRRPGVLRSVNPTHAFAGWGKNAEKYLQNHANVPAMGEGSPLDLLMKDGGYCLLLGVDYRPNTFHHVVETLEGAPCLAPAGEVFPMRLKDGTEIQAYTWSWRNARCPIDDGARYAPRMEAIHRQETIGQAACTLYKLSEGYEIIADCLKNGIDGLEGCKNCPVRPRVCAYTVQ